jgi:hypothetical protein
MKKSLHVILAGLGLAVVHPAFAQTAAAPATTPTPAPASTAAPKPDVPYPEQLATLPGKGLAQHDFLYTGEWDTRNPQETMSLVRGGKVVWTYQIPDRDESNGELAEYSDMHRLSNGDIVFAYKTGWRKIDKDGKTIYDYKCPKVVGADGKDILNAKGKPVYGECHTAQPIGMDKVLFMVNGLPAKLYLYNLKTDKIEMEHVMKTKPTPTQEEAVKSIHGQFRNVRMIKGGHYLIAHMNLGKVIEYDANWKEVWSCEAPSVWHATRLKNGNTLIAGNQHGFAREISPIGEIVWEVKKGDLPGITINGVHQAQRLANGNTVITNWTANVKKPDWPKIIQLIEVTPDKKVVWAINQWSDPDLGPASCIQLLDEPGKAEDLDLMR